MNLKESTLYHLNACEKAKTKVSWNYHYAIYLWQKGSKEFVSDKEKVKLWNKLKKYMAMKNAIKKICEVKLCSMLIINVNNI